MANPHRPPASGSRRVASQPAGLRFASLVALWLLALLPGPLAASADTGAATPQALVERLSAAARSGDLAAFVSCLKPEQRHVYAVHELNALDTMMAFFAGAEPGAPPADAAAAAQQVAAFRASSDPILEPARLMAFREAVLVKHRIRERLDGRSAAAIPAAEYAALFAEVDEGELCADLSAVVDALVPQERRRPHRLLAGFPAGELGAPKVEGDRAAVQAGDVRLDLVRLDDGRWYLEMPARE